MLRRLSEWFWCSDFWLPANVTWADLESTETVQYARFSDLLHPIPMAFFFLLIRFFVEKFLWAPIGKMMGLRDTRPKRPLPNGRLEQAYRLHRRVGHQQVLRLAEEVSMTERQVERWLRLRKLQDTPNRLTRFTENGWQFFYYLLIFCYGLHTLWSKSWFWDIRYCFYDLPFHAMENDVWWYYMLSLAFYWSMTFRHFFDVKHKDFWEMLIHHLVTICLLSFSWSCNFIRTGTLVLIVHDISDIFLLGAKMLRYLRLQTLCDITFAVFVVLWLVTRLGVFSFWIIHNTIYKATFIVRVFPAYYVFNGLLLLLLILHCIWTYYIMLVAYRALLVGQMSGDSRSDSSEEMASEASDEDQEADDDNKVMTSSGDVTSVSGLKKRRAAQTSN